jgi:hypothetical protein
LQVQFVIENATKIESFETPVFRDFKIMQGPMETSGMSIVNNQLSEYKSLTFVLQPLRKGRLTITGASAIVNGKKLVSNKIMVNVGDASSPGFNPNKGSLGINPLHESAEEDFMLRENEDADEKIKKNLLVKLLLDKTTAYVGEPIVATYKLYTRLRSESRVSKRPSMNGFSVYDMIEPYGASPVVEKLNGKSFMVHIIRKTQLIPLQDGSFELDPVELENNVRFLRSRNNSGLPPGKSSVEKMFDDLLDEPNGNWEQHKITLSSAPVKIVIKPLPSGAPAGFSGAVGRFSMQGLLKDSVVSTGDNASYELQIKGTGNLPLINAPDWSLPAGIDHFDPTVAEQINKTVSPMAGQKIFTYSFSTGKTGSIVLPAVEFSYFDVAAKQYKTLTTAAATLQVVKGNTPPIVASVLARQKNNSLPMSYIIAIIGFGTALLALTWLLIKQKKQSAPIHLIPPTPVEQPRQDPLAATRAAIVKNDPAMFYRTMEAALWQILTQKLQLTGTALQKQGVELQLARLGLPAEKLTVLKNCFDACEWALYVPKEDNTVDLALFQQLENLLPAIEALPSVSR